MSLHLYELTLSPTEAQAAELLRLARVRQQRLAGSALAQARTAATSRPLPALSGPGLVRPLRPGWIEVPGVAGPLAAATDHPGQLPRWAREVIGREYRPAPPMVLVRQVPALRQARRLDWADIRWEHGRWVLELNFEWHAFPSWDLSWCALHAEPDHALLRQLMG
ncbi:hypothetical protein [Deinococcus sp. NW-56]|uniref:hypothetical protein n=1 Tax=Deinococcus sp. NW-56 TaxID=2080419 RepID=UPI000CF47778|nr:hypothetical protein [Deinococcus sp. NW-56]